MDFLNVILDGLAEWAILFIELVGVLMIIAAVILGLIALFRRDPLARLKLDRGLATGLAFLMGGEILRTILVRDLQGILVVGALVLLRGALALLIHWEIRSEEQEERREK